MWSSFRCTLNINKYKKSHWRPVSQDSSVSQNRDLSEQVSLYSMVFYWSRPLMKDIFMKEWYSIILVSVSWFQAPQADEQPISIKSAIVDIAYDYTKRRNVFRLTTYNGSEYLLQADDHETMMEWIRAIQTNNNPDQDVSFHTYFCIFTLLNLWNSCFSYIVSLG